MPTQNFRRFFEGLGIVPKSSSTASSMGELEVNSGTGKLQYNNGSSTSPVVTEAHAATLTNKIITAPVISSIVNIGTLTLPTSTDTLVGRNTTDTLTNKSISGSTNTLTNLPNSAFSSMPAHTFKGNNTGSPSAPLDLTATQLTAELNNMIGDSGSGGTKGLVPAPPPGSAFSKFLRADGTWQITTGGGLAVGTIDSGSPSANGSVITGGGLLIEQSASASFPGLVNNTTQTFSGNKTFNNNLTVSNNLNVSVITDTGTGINIDSGTNGSTLFLQTNNGRVRVLNGGIHLEQFVSAPTPLPVAGSDALYFKADDNLYSVNSSGVEKQVTSAVLPGIIQMYGGVSAPSGFLMCDGTSYLRATYPSLFTAIGTAFGSADGTHFNVPDMRGYFPRGTDNGAGRDPDAASRTAMNPGGNTGDNVGSVQVDEYASHTHTLTTSNASGGAQTRAESSDAANGDRTVTTNADGGNETRPKNANVNYIIKY